MQNTIVDQYHGDPLYAQLHVLSRERPLVREMLKTAAFEKVAVDSLPSTAFAWEDERRFPIHTKEDAVASILYRSKCASVPSHVDDKLTKATEIYGIEDHVFATKVAQVGLTKVAYALPDDERLPLGNEGQIKVAEYVLKRDYQLLPLEKRADAFSKLAMAAREQGVELEPITMKMAGMTICSTQMLRDWLGARAAATEKLAATIQMGLGDILEGPSHIANVYKHNFTPSNWFTPQATSYDRPEGATTMGSAPVSKQPPTKVAFNAGATYIEHGPGKYVPITGVADGGYELGAPEVALPAGRRSIGLPEYQEAAKALVAAQQAQKVAAAFDKLADDLRRSPPYIQDRPSLVKLAAAIDTLDRLAGLEQHYDRKLPDPLQTVFNTEKVAMEMVDVAGMQVPVDTLMQLPPEIWEQVDMPELAEIAQAGDPVMFKQVFDTMPLDIKVVLQAQLGG